MMSFDCTCVAKPQANGGSGLVCDIMRYTTLVITSLGLCQALDDPGPAQARGPNRDT